MRPEDVSKIMMPARDQKDGQTCLAFAASSVHEHLRGIKNYFSPAYLYGLAWPTDPTLNGHNGLTFKSVQNIISNPGQVYEECTPYEEWLAKSYPHSDFMPDEEHFLSDLTMVSPNFKNIITFLDKNTPVILGIDMNDAFFDVNVDGYINEPGKREMGGHAVVAVAHFQNKNENYLWIRNSWGKDWGIAGYALISEEYLKNRLMAAAILVKKGN